MAKQSIEKQDLVDRLKPFGQEHLLDFWEELSSSQRQALAQQIEAVDLGQIDSLFRGEVDQPDWAELSRIAEPPPAVRLHEQTGTRNQAAIDRGIEALRAGKVGVMITAGGQGSRLGFELPKSLYPIGPISSASLLQIHIEKIRASAQRYGVAIPLYLMTSPATHDDTIRFLDENDRFGLSADDLFVFCQGTMPSVDIETGKLLLAEKDQLFLSPDGHGGTVAALDKSAALKHMQSRAIDQLFYLQIDNPLVPICDPLLIGHHLLAKSELTSLTVQKKHAMEKWGNFAMIDGHMHVIEYSDLPDEVAKLCDAEGKLKLWAGSLAIHVFERSLFERALQKTDMLPFHVARKKVPFIAADGSQMTPDMPNALKFERFIFDLLPAAERPLVVEYREEECFAPLKNAPGAEIDTPEYVQQMMLDQHRHWLTAAGAVVAPGVDVEISPLFAVDAEQVAERIKPGQRYDKSQYLT
ncbi:UTP--glucose-1-phosphate uridylyltransferase [Bythopirellula polymerisocia]|uniref:Putative uridylyltransferase n=1 Tax=Bythopirellula polymerisocia TaxID=2528003 RepID=A0A5C6CEK4_9BACT|nr:UTP--glucose-1-phosphate uridylyltransferase [Bythopirellula polymerisocia]TWU21944.1 putative uridylyltransferase [Bythopirellula polymerisocia]